jgi:hypothetical protein
MSDRLDRLEKIVESNSKAIESWANESIQYRRDAEDRDRQMAASIERLTSVSELLVSANSQLTQVATALAARQQDQENRISRLENT